MFQGLYLRMMIECTGTVSCSLMVETETLVIDFIGLSFTCSIDFALEDYNYFEK